MRDDVGVEARDVGNILQLEELLACGGVNVHMNLAIALHIGAAIIRENGVDPIWLLERGLVETAEVVADMNGGTAV